MSYRVTSPHAIDLADGRFHPPGAIVEADPAQAHDAALIEAGVLREIPAAPEPQPETTPQKRRRTTARKEGAA